MGLTDDIKNAATDATGKAKEAYGDATGDNKAKAEGLLDQAKAGIGKVVEDVKDAAEDIKNDLTK